MDITLITKIAAAGALGVSIYCIIKVYDLLKLEQKEKTPRPTFIRTIYVSMSFAVLMTLLSLGIETIRYYMDSNIIQLEKDLDKIARESYYSVNSNGNPKEINITYKDQTYVLSKAFSKDHFKSNELKLKKTEDERYLAINKNLDEEIILGFISNEHIKVETKNLFTDIIGKSLSENELWGLGIFHTPLEMTKIIKPEAKEDRSLANEYLIKLLSLDHNDNISKKEKAMRFLVQPQLMNKLSQNQYKVLINALQLGQIRETPWDKYELAQVHLSRAGQSWNKAKENDKVKHKELLKEYITFYNDYKWIRNREKYPKEFKWYEESRSKLGIK
jgi:hypothetical protein